MKSRISLFFNFNSLTVVFIVLGFLVYSRALFNGFVWDNFPQIQDYSAVRHFRIGEIFTSSAAFGKDANIFTVYYKPLMYSAFSLVFLGFGDLPFGYHFLQISLHIANSMLLFVFFSNFFKRKWAFLFSLVFLVHPMNFESAGYISALQDTLYFFFGICALLFLIKDTDKTAWSFKTYLFVGFLLLLSLFSKEGGYLFVALCFMYILFFKRMRFGIFTSTFIISQVFYLIFRQVSVGNIYGYLTISAMAKEGIYHRLITLPAVIYYYMSKFFLPLSLSINNHFIVTKFSLTGFFLPLFVVTGFIAVLFYFFKSYKNKSKNLKVFGFFLLWFCFGLFFHSQILFTLDMTVADRWFYVPMVGLLGIIGVIISDLEKSKTLNIRRTKIFWVLAIIVVLGFSVRTFVRSFDWKDEKTLIRHDMLVSENNYSLENMYGAILLRQGDLENAYLHLTRSNLLNPGYREPYTNLGYYFEAKGDFNRSKENYEKSLDLDSGASNMQTYRGLSRILLFMNEDPEASKKVAFSGLEQYSKDTYLLAMLAVCEYAQGNKDKALADINKIYETDKTEFVVKTKRAIEDNRPVK